MHWGSRRFRNRHAGRPRSRWTRGGARPIVVNNLPIDSMGTKRTSGLHAGPRLQRRHQHHRLLPADQLSPAPRYAVIVPDHHQGTARMAYAEPTTAGHIVPRLDPEPYPTTMQRLSAIPESG